MSKIKNIENQMKKAIALGVVFLPFLIGLTFYFLEEFDYLTPGSYFGSSAWPNYIIGLSGLFLWLFSIPTILTRSYKNWKNKKRSWIFYLLLIPIFYLIGLFFQIGLGYFIFVTLYLGSAILLFIFFNRLYKLRREHKSAYFLVLFLIITFLILLMVLAFQGNLNVGEVKIWLRQKFF